MRAISGQIESDVYLDLKHLADRAGRPVAEMIRAAVAQYLMRRPGRESSIFELRPHNSGSLLNGWIRSGLLEEMLDA